MAGRLTRGTPIADLPQFLRVPEVAAWLDCGRGSVYAMIADGRLPAIRIGSGSGRLLRVSREALAALIEQTNTTEHAAVPPAVRATAVATRPSSARPPRSA